MEKITNFDAFHYKEKPKVLKLMPLEKKVPIMMKIKKDMKLAPLKYEGDRKNNRLSQSIMLDKNDYDKSVFDNMYNTSNNFMRQTKYHVNQSPERNDLIRKLKEKRI